LLALIKTLKTVVAATEIADTAAGFKIIKARFKMLGKKLI
jgi:hypothetical protein